MIILITKIAFIFNISDWRQSAYNLKKVKKLSRKISNLKHSTSKNEDKKEKRAKLIQDSYEIYIELGKDYVKRATETIEKIRAGHNVKADEKDIMKALLYCIEVEGYIADAKLQINQIDKRVLQGEKLPHSEKTFSIFEKHIEWISKGKKGVPQEFGIRHCILEDQYGFILHYEVMEKKTDDKVAIDMIWEAKIRFNGLMQTSFDKGFYSRENKQNANELLDKVVMPKKGKLNKEEKKEEGAEDFKKARNKHSAVESGINGLMHTGLDKCRDKGLESFKRYAAFGVTARNIFTLGAILMKKIEATRVRKTKYQKTIKETLIKKIAV